MIKIPDNVKMLLKRTESVLEKKCKNEIFLEETRYYKTIYLDFQEFKKKIDNRSSIYLLKLEADNWKSKIEFINAIRKYWRELSNTDIMTIKNDVYESMYLESEVAKLKENVETLKEAQHLLEFIKDGRYCCWGHMDEDAESKIFRLVTSSKFSQILKFDEVLELTPKTEDSVIQYKKIQVAMRYEPVDERMYMEKKLYNEYIEFCNEFQERWDKNPRAYQLDVKAFNLWNNARNTATYYICI